MSIRPLRRLLLVVPLTLLLAACADTNTPAPTATAVPPTATTAPQAQPTATPAAASTTTTTTTEATATPTSEVRTFTIVAEESEAQYSVEEEFLGQSVGFIDTVGTTKVITGEFQLQIDGTQVTLKDGVVITVNFTARS